MGGNLLKNWNLPPKRATTAELYATLQQFEKALHADYILCNMFKPDAFNRFKCHIAPFIRDKADHGDIDIIIVDKNKATTPVFGVDGVTAMGLPAYIKARYGYEPHINDGVISFPLNGIQIDLTILNPSESHSYISYSSWGDLGNIMGRIYHKLGVHYGHKGLALWIREDMFRGIGTWEESSHIVSKTVFETEMESILKLGGFDEKKWLAGFDTEEDAFQFIANSRYFNADIFKIENLNHQNRTRNRKRGMYMRFIEWIEKTSPPNRINTYPPKRETLVALEDIYPYISDAITKARNGYEKSIIFRSRFNGTAILDLIPECPPNKIGSIISIIRGQDISLMELISMEKAEINKLIVETYNLIMKPE